MNVRSMPTRSLLSLVLAAIVLIIAHYEGGQAFYDFGIPGAIPYLIDGLLLLLAVTHAVIGGIMWVQRDRWLPSDGAMFRFIVAKAIYWAYTSFLITGTAGIRLEVLVVFLLIAITTIDLDVRLVRRYVLDVPSERDDTVAWDGITDRRVGPPDRRQPT